jgi:hypothetical protein
MQGSMALMKDYSFKEMHLKHSLLNWKLWMACVLAITAAACTSSAPPQQAGPPRPAATTPSTPASTKDLWRSITTGKEYRVKIVGDTLTADWANVPADAPSGTSIHSECHKKGDKWIGTSAINMSCTLGKGKDEHIANSCHLTLQFEIDTVTKDKIAGRGQGLEQFDCTKCKVLMAGWGDFVWVPVGAPGPR